MKRSLRLMAGVTLLEIMLVLAIAAMIIVMSIRYYQSATTNQQAASLMESIQSITAAADTLAQTSGTYATVVSTAAITNLVPAGTMSQPWGGTITISAPTTTTYTVTIANIPAGLCQQVYARLTNLPAYKTGLTTCPTTGTGSLAYTYTNNAT